MSYHRATLDSIHSSHFLFYDAAADMYRCAHCPVTFEPPYRADGTPRDQVFRRADGTEESRLTVAQWQALQAGTA